MSNEPIHKYLIIVQAVAFGIVLAVGVVSLYKIGHDSTNEALGADLRVFTVRQGGTGTSTDWTTFNGKGNVTKVGTPADNQVGVWTGDGTIEGNTALTFTGDILTITNNEETGAATALIVQGDRATPTANDEVIIEMRLSDSAGNQDTMGTIRAQALDVTSTSEDSQLKFGTVIAGTLASRLALTGTGLQPNTDDALSLGNATANRWSDLYLAEGGVINWDNGDAKLTQVGDVLTLEGANLTVPIFVATSTTATNGITTNATSTSFFSALGTFTNMVVNTLATFLNVVVTGLLDIGGGVLEIPNGAAPTVDAIGELALDSTSNQLVLYGSAKKVIGDGNLYPAFTYATSTAWTGTTTIPLGTAYTAETWNGVQCFTDTGTVNVDFGDGTNFMNATTSKALNPAPIHTLSTNNTFTAGETRYARVGTPVSTPTKISCTVSKSLTSD